jgi:hypothetical protein
MVAGLQEAELAQKQYVGLRRDHEALQSSILTQVGLPCSFAHLASVVNMWCYEYRLQHFGGSCTALVC